MASIRAAVRVLRGHPFASDATLAFVLTAFVLQDVVFTNGGYLTGQRSVYVPAALLMTVPLAWRRRAPLLVVCIVMAALSCSRCCSLPRRRRRTRSSCRG